MISPPYDRLVRCAREAHRRDELYDRPLAVGKHAGDVHTNPVQTDAALGYEAVPVSSRFG
jgi:hypothetical protein